MLNHRIFRGSIFLLFIFLLYTAGFLYLSRNWYYDDPFITYRYADNLAGGKGFVYNQGERVLSTTTPLFTFLLSIPAVLGVNLPNVAKLFGVLSLFLGGYFLWDLGKSYKTPLVGIVSGSLFATFPLVFITIGSETPLYLALSLGAFAFYSRKQYLWAAVFASLAILARPDGILVAGILILHFTVRFFYSELKTESITEGKISLNSNFFAATPFFFNPVWIKSFIRQIPWKAVTIFILVSLSWYLFSWVYFGSLFPVTLAAKQQQGLMEISQKFAPGLLRILGWYSTIPYWYGAILAAIGLWALIWKARSWGLIVGWSILYFIAYSLLGVSSYFWYYAPLVTGFAVLAGITIQFAVELIYKLLKNIYKPSIPAFFVLSLILASPVLYENIRFVNNTSLQIDPRYQVYQAAGNWLDQHTPSNASVGALEIGIIGYYGNRYLIDFAGLIQPAVAKHLTEKATYEDAAIYAIETYNPDYLILHDRVFVRLEEQFIGSICQPTHSFLGSHYNYPLDITIYSCQWGDQ
jgi:hypothetical protein